MSRVEQALACFNDGFNCAQSMVATYGPLYGIDRGMGLRIGSALGAGLARTGATCGAVLGAFMVIGLKHGMSSQGDLESKETAYALANQFMVRFTAKNGTLSCRELLGCDLGTDEGMRYAVVHSLFATRCSRYVADAAGIIEEILDVE